jgi:hypothetical protein
VPSSMVSWYNERWSAARSMARLSSFSQDSRSLVRTGINQVERHAREDVARKADGFERFFDGVKPAEEFQLIVVQRLDAHRHAVDAGGAVATEPVCFNARRIGFEGDFDVFRDRPKAGDGIEKRADGRTGP